MANYSAIKAAVNGYIKQNGRKEITGSILNAVLNAVIDSLGRYFQFAGGAMPTDDPGTPDQNVCYLATEPGLYTNFGNIRIENEEVALLFWNGEWVKQTIAIGIREVYAEVDGNVGDPSVDVSYSDGSLVLTFHNLKGKTGNPGEQGEPAGFGTIGADVNNGVGTPKVSVETSGSNTAKNIMFHFTNLKGDPGVSSVIATIDETTGIPSCQVSLVNGVLTLAFSGLKGLKGDTGVSADYPITIYNGLDSDATDQALAAAQGKILDQKIGALNVKVGDMIVSDAHPADLDVEDGQGNILARFSGGHMQVQKFNSADIEGLAQGDTQYADLEVADAEGNAIVRFSDGHIKTKNFDSRVVGTKTGYQRETYFDTTNDCIQQNASSFEATNPNTYVSQVIFDDHAVLILPDSYSQIGTPTRLIIFCKQGNSQITDSSNPIMATNAMGNIFHFLVSRGYAVLAADGVPDGLTSSLGLDDTRVSGNYVAIQSTRKAYDYVIKNYNIYDDGAFIFGYSQGGMYAQNVIDLSGIPFLGCAMVSPALSMRFHLWDLSSSKTIGGVNWTRTSRLNIARLYGFDPVTTNAELLALQFDKEKVAGYDPWNRNVENPYDAFTQTSPYASNLWALPEGVSIDSITMKKKIGCPTKIWVAENDATLGVDITKVFVKACRNAGQMCDLHLYNSGNHHIFQNTYQNPAITTFSDQGNSYNLYAIAYEIASFFNRLGGYPLNLN